MSIGYAVALSFGPVLVAILAAALILPRAWLASYAAFVIVATIIYADYSGRYDDAALRNMLSALFSMLVVAALGRRTHHPLGAEVAATTTGLSYLRPSRFSIASQMRSSSTTLSKRLISCRPVGEVTLISVR